jgi:hypothetical protein
MDVVAPWSWAPAAPSQHTQKPGIQILLSYSNSFLTVPGDATGPIAKAKVLVSTAVLRSGLKCSFLNRSACSQYLRYRRGATSVDS